MTRRWLSPRTDPLNQSAEAEPSAQSDDQPETHWREHFRGNAPHDVPSARPERHADANLTAALDHRVVEHAIETHTREQECNHGEESESEASRRSRSICRCTNALCVPTFVTRKSERI